MAISQIVKKTGLYENIGSDYLTPEPHARNVKIGLYIDVYLIEPMYGSLTAPIYQKTLTGKCINADFTIDSTSDMRSSCSLEMIFDDDEFTGNIGNYFWGDKLLRIVKTYDYLNDKNMYPKYQWGDRIGLWNNNGVWKSDPSQCVIGWFLPNQASFSYNESTKVVSLSCIDVMALLTENRGGHLAKVSEETFFYVGSPEISYDSSSGITLKGEKKYQDIGKQFPNFLYELQYHKEKDNSFEIPARWKAKYDEFIKVHPVFNENELLFTDKEDVDTEDFSFHINTHDGKKYDVYWLINDILQTWLVPPPYSSVYIRLQNDEQGLPYDIEFNGDATLYDVFKKIIDLYPRQAMYFDSNLQLNFVQYGCAVSEVYNNTHFKAREFMGLVIDEQWNKNYENVKNWVTVFGRENSCCGTYFISEFMSYCDNYLCNGTYYLTIHPEGSKCPKCGNTLKRLYSNNPLAIEAHGIHKYVVYNDTYLTDEECENAAKYMAIESCRCAETLTVTLLDRYLSMYHWADKGVGTRIEYKSKITGETNLYTLLKWSNNFADGTITMELEPWYPIIDEYAINVKHIDDGGNPIVYLPAPEFTYTIDDGGNLVMLINNGIWTSDSLFKVYISPTNADFGESVGSIEEFVGETCEVYTPSGENNFETKVFRYKFQHSGLYTVKCMAWNPDIHYSGFSKTQTISVTITQNRGRLLTHNGKQLTLSNGSYILKS